VNEGFKYWAFVSYSHRDNRSEGNVWGDWLHEAVENFKVPPELVGKPGRHGEPVPPRLYPAFQDEKELPTNADLGTAIQEALEQSRYLVVICSPRSAKSIYVNQEVMAFKRLGRANKILAIIIDGEPNASEPSKGLDPSLECFPEALRHPLGADGKLDKAQRAEPIAADVRGVGGREASLGDKAHFHVLEREKLRVMAGLLGVGFDELVHRDKERQLREARARALRMRKLAAAFALLAIASVVGGVMAISKGREAEKQRQDAVIQRRTAEAKKYEALQTLGRFDFFQADRCAAENRPNEALAWWAAALRHDPANALAAQRIASALADRDQPMLHSRLVRPSENLTSICPSPSGSFFVGADGKYSLRAYDSASGEPISRGIVHPGYVRSHAFNADGTRLATICEQEGVPHLASGSRWFGIVEPKTGRTIRNFEKTTAENVVTGADGSVFLTYEGHRLTRWDALTGQQMGDMLEIPESVRAAALGADNASIAVAAGDGLTRIRDAVSGQIIAPTLEHRGETTAVVFDASGKILATGSEDGTARIWNAITGQPTIPPLPHEGGIEVLAMSPDGRRIATVTRNEHKVRLWDAVTGALVSGPLVLGGDWVTLSFSSDNRALLVVARGAGTHVFSTATGQALIDPIVADGGVSAAEWAEGSEKILVMARNQAVELWSVVSSRARALKFSHGAAVNAIDLNPEGTRLVTGGADGIVRAWEIDSAAERFSIRGNGQAILGVSYTGEGSWLRTEKESGVHHWDAETGADLGASNTESAGGHFDLGEAWSMVSADRRLRLSAQRNNEIEVFEDNHPSPIATFSLSHAPSSGEFSPDKKRIVISCNDDTVHLFDVRNGRRVGRHITLLDAIRDVHFSPDSRYLATASQDGTARLWDAAVGVAISEPLVHDGAVEEVRFTPDSKAIITRAGNAAYLWMLPSLETPVPVWLPHLAEAVSGQCVNPQGELQASVQDRLESIGKIRDEVTAMPETSAWAVWGRWFLANPSTRTISPYSKITVLE
jgi:WD40 repeat protein